MDNIVWNRPMIVLNNIVIMPDTSSHLDVISKESCEAVANAIYYAYFPLHYGV